MSIPGAPNGQDHEGYRAHYFLRSTQQERDALVDDLIRRRENCGSFWQSVRIGTALMIVANGPSWVMSLFHWLKAHFR